MTYQDDFTLPTELLEQVAERDGSNSVGSIGLRREGVFLSPIPQSRHMSRRDELSSCTL
jgi:hypothetical protein